MTELNLLHSRKLEKPGADMTLLFSPSCDEEQMYAIEQFAKNQDDMQTGWNPRPEGASRKYKIVPINGIDYHLKDGLIPDYWLDRGEFWSLQILRQFSYPLELVPPLDSFHYARAQILLDVAPIDAFLTRPFSDKFGEGIKVITFAQHISGHDPVELCHNGLGQGLTYIPYHTWELARLGASLFNQKLEDQGITWGDSGKTTQFVYNCWKDEETGIETLRMTLVDPESIFITDQIPRDDQYT